MKFFNLGLKNKIAAPPGTVIHVGEQKSRAVDISVIHYGTADYSEIKVDNTEEIRTPKKKGAFTWIDVTGLHDTDTVNSLGQKFGIDSLVLEDIVNTTHRPKIEEYDEYTVQIMKTLHYYPEKRELSAQQISFLLGSNFLITFAEERMDIFDPVRQRIRKGRKNITTRGADYLMYALTDVMVDHYFVALEGIGEEIERIEEEVLDQPSPKSLHSIQKLKKEIIFLRKTVWPMREILNEILRNDISLLQESNTIYFRDVYDHTIQIIETAETFRDLTVGLQDLYMATVSNNMNQVMKVLTIIATIFIPLTFIAGIYGMNFDFMPELKWKIGYFVVLGFMVLIGAGMWIWFKRKKWW